MRKTDWSRPERPSPIPAARARRTCAILLCSTALAWSTACDDAAAPASPPAAREVVFSPEGNNLWAYETEPPFGAQRVNTANHAFDETPEDPGDVPQDPDGWDINGQICFFRHRGATFMVSGEDTGQPDPPPGWGVFRVEGARVGGFSIDRIGRLVPTYQPTADGPDTFGCGLLSDGRLVTTDIGNNQFGEANGQLTIWFPPFDRFEVPYCKIDLRLATGQQIWVSPGDDVYVVSPRPAPEPDATASGVFRYRGPFPTSPDASGGCGRTDSLGSPLADSFRKEKVLAAGDHGLASPSGIVGTPDGHFYVSSVITGVINEYDADWRFVRTVLAPPPGDTLGTTTYSTGTPLGLGLSRDGTLWYADIGIVFRGGGFGPGRRNGSLRRIVFTDGEPGAPEVVASGLRFPDALGTWPPSD